MVHPRKAHRKSRRGCVECKRRHVKCDETHPKCVNCNVSQRTCSYEDLVSTASSLVQAPRPKSKRATQSKEEHQGTPDSPNPGAISDDPPINKLHLELLHHFVANIESFVGQNKLSCEVSVIGITSQILATPFLMNELLAFAAFHLSIIHPEKRAFYQYHSSQLQTHALSEFNGQRLEVSADTCVPIFLFSSCLGLHTLADRLLFRAAEFQSFLDRFIQSLIMHRGVRAISNQAWHHLLQSPLKSHLESEMKRLNEGTPGNECLELLSHVDDMHDSTASATYQQVIKDLQKVYNATRSPLSEFSQIGPIISWPVLLPQEYIDLLLQRRPEALAILSHFGALLHLHREIWAFGDGGYYLISSIKRHLGPDWASWLRWPNTFL